MRRKPRLLVVDDEPSLLRLLQVAMESDGYEVLLASDGETALARVREEDPDLLLLDIMMPVLDGWGVLERLSELPKRPKVICLTAKESRRDRAKAWRLGADEYVTKPFDVDDLSSLVEEVLHRSPSQQEERRKEALNELGADASAEED